MATYLVIGGAGFIGSHICEELLHRGERVRILDNFVTGSHESIKDFDNKVELVKGDIRDIDVVKKSVSGVDYVLHQAALRSVPVSVEHPELYNEVNVTGTLNVLIASRDAGVKRLVYASSSSCYGDNNILPQVENLKTNPISPYAVSKLAGEHYCYVFSKIYGLETASLRYFNVFGPRQDPKSQYAVVIPIFINHALNGKTFEVHGDGLQSRDFTYIDNAVEANILACTSPNASGKVFNVACGERHTVLDIVKTLESIMNKKLSFEHTPPRKGDVRHTLADISSARDILGYKVKVKFEEGLRKTFGWFGKNI